MPRRLPYHVQVAVARAFASAIGRFFCLPWDNRKIQWNRQLGRMVARHLRRSPVPRHGEVSEWLIELVSKTSVLYGAPRVRIPPSPFPILICAQPLCAGSEFLYRRV